MTRHQVKDEKECLRRMDEYLNNITPQQVDGFCTESNKIRHLRNAEIGKKIGIYSSQEYLHSPIQLRLTGYDIE